MKRLIYITITYILLAAVSHAKSWFETHPNYFATAAINDADSITFDEYFTGGTIALRSPAISKGDTIWTLFCCKFQIEVQNVCGENSMKNTAEVCLAAGVAKPPKNIDG